MPKEITLKDIQESIVGMRDLLSERLDDLHEAMQLHAFETDRQFREMRSTTATKDYVDDRIGELRGEFRQALKRSRGGQAAA